MSHMFYSCRALKKINTKIFKENKLTNLNYVFKDCNSLKDIDLSNFETKILLNLMGHFIIVKI